MKRSKKKALLMGDSKNPNRRKEYFINYKKTKPPKPVFFFAAEVVEEPKEIGCKIDKDAQS
jgi:hypothetical protein